MPMLCTRVTDPLGNVIDDRALGLVKLNKRTDWGYQTYGQKYLSKKSKDQEMTK